MFGIAVMCGFDTPAISRCRVSSDPGENGSPKPPTFWNSYTRTLIYILISPRSSLWNFRGGLRKKFLGIFHIGWKVEFSKKEFGWVFAQENTGLESYVIVIEYRI